MEVELVREAAAKLADEILGPNDARREWLIEELVKFATTAPALGKPEPPAEAEAEKPADEEEDDDDPRKAGSAPKKKK